MDTPHPLREWRTANGYTLRQLGLRARVSIGAINEIERGLSSPSALTALRLIRATGLTLEQLLGEDEDKEAAE